VSVTLDLMIHDLDLVALLFGGAPRAVTAQGVTDPGPEFDDVTAKLTFATGEAQLRASRIAPARRRTLRAVYPSGEVRLDFLTRTLSNSTPFPLDPNFADKVKDPLGRNVETFLDAVAARGASAIPAESGAEAVALAEAVDRACKT
jgi:predicted dehydrogenase